MPSLDLQKQSREAAFVRLLCARWHTMSEKSIWALVFLHYNQQIVSWSEVQEVCNLTDLVSVGIDSESEDETIDVLTWEGHFLFSSLSLIQDVSVIDKDCWQNLLWNVNDVSAWKTCHFNKITLCNTVSQSYDLRYLEVSFFGLQITKYISIRFHGDMLETVYFQTVILNWNFRHKIRLLCNWSANFPG